MLITLIALSLKFDIGNKGYFKLSLSLKHLSLWKELAGFEELFIAEVKTKFQGIFSIAFTDEFSSSDHVHLYNLLSTIRLRDIRIIVGFFGQKSATTVLCEVYTYVYLHTKLMHSYLFNNNNNNNDNNINKIHFSSIIIYTSYLSILLYLFIFIIIIIIIIIVILLRLTGI